MVILAAPGLLRGCWSSFRGQEAQGSIVHEVSFCFYFILLRDFRLDDLRVKSALFSFNGAGLPFSPCSGNF